MRYLYFGLQQLRFEMFHVMLTLTKRQQAVATTTDMILTRELMSALYLASHDSVIEAFLRGEKWISLLLEVILSFVKMQIRHHICRGDCSNIFCRLLRLPIGVTKWRCRLSSCWPTSCKVHLLPLEPPSSPYPRTSLSNQEQGGSIYPKKQHVLSCIDCSISPPHRQWNVTALPHSRVAAATLFVSRR